MSSRASQLEPEEYLNELVLPVLLPGIEALLKAVKKRDPMLSNPTAEIQPLIWLAQYLARNNPKYLNNRSQLEIEDGSLSGLSQARLDAINAGVNEALSRSGLKLANSSISNIKNPSISNPAGLGNSERISRAGSVIE